VNNAKRGHCAVVVSVADFCISQKTLRRDGSYLDVDQRRQLATLAEGGKLLHQEELLAVSAHLLDVKGADEEQKEREGDEQVTADVVALLANALREKLSILATDDDAFVEC